MSVREVQPKRHIALIILLIVAALAQVFGVFVGFTTWQSRVEHSQSGQALPLIGTIMGILALIAIGGIWMWRRWAVYLFALIAALGLVIDAIFGVPSLTLLIRIVLLATLGWFIRAQWAAFR